MNDWPRKYIGIPFETMKCFELVTFVLKQEKQIELITISEFDEQFANEFGLQIDSIYDIKPFDILIFNLNKLDTHCGIAIDSRKMLHTMRQANACVADFTGSRYKGRIAAIYRLKALL